MKRRIRELKGLLQGESIEVLTLQHTKSGHCKIRARAGDAEKLFVTSGTPSDRRSNLNLLGDIRRWVRSLEQ